MPHSVRPSNLQCIVLTRWFFLATVHCKISHSLHTIRFQKQDRQSSLNVHKQLKTSLDEFCFPSNLNLLPGASWLVSLAEIDQALSKTAGFYIDLMSQ